ncbi:hypothetical protein Pmani_023053 [Petrolisthes manimaculis]|uniref:Angiotensin-converting enzyme n=1 Tax=Petrolisthes manimaculis TaxID=1843537 RepID=A0AAE1U0K2_9EUCA|nr:hypothetical protein Pmani_023053 [Petrolisthes manimaculis]
MLLWMVLLCVGTPSLAYLDAPDGGQAGSPPTVLVGREVVEAAAEVFVQKKNKELSLQCTKTMKASWHYHTNLTSHNKAVLMAAQSDYQRVRRSSWEEARKWRVLHHFLTLRPALTRQMTFLSHLGPSALPYSYLTMYESVVEDMLAVYRSASVCLPHNPPICGVSMNTGLVDVMAGSRDEGVLKHVWREWRQQTSRVKHSFPLYLQMVKKAANINDFPNKADADLAEYGGSPFREELTNAWNQLKPLYTHLHAYTRRKLRQVYGSEVVSERGPLPAHLLGNMWGQSWDLGDLLVPYPGQSYPDLTKEMKRQGYTPHRIFEAANRFFGSLNLTLVPSSFWRDSLLQQPTDNRPVICSPSAWDLCNAKDYRVKQCTRLRGKDLISAHHELAHLQYFMQYRHLPYVFRQAPNPGFQEGVGLAVGLSATSPRYLRRLGLITPEQEEGNSRADLNLLMSLALQQITFLPFALLMEEWRWRVAEGTIKRRNWNCAWWDLRYSIQGVKPPVPRSEEDFDPGSKYHIAADLPYTGYLVAFILQFQIHKALCVKADRYQPLIQRRPLHKCHIFQSLAAGEALGSMMRLGKSVGWREALEQLTGPGGGKLNALPTREYFRPLELWLERDNARHGEYVGWRPDGEYCVYKTPSPKGRSCK